MRMRSSRPETTTSRGPVNRAVPETSSTESTAASSEWFRARTARVSVSRRATAASNQDCGSSPRRDLIHRWIDVKPDVRSAEYARLADLQLSLDPPTLIS